MKRDGKLPQLHVRAEVRADTIKAEDRTVEIVWTTGAPVKRYGWDGAFFEKLSMKPEHIRMDRLASGAAPYLNSHGQWDLRDVIGVVEKAWLDGDKGRAVVRFSRRPEVDGIWRDVQDGILKNVSVGYRVHKFERQPLADGEKIPTLLATDWEPIEASQVAVGADPDAGVGRSEERALFPVEIVTNSIAERGEEDSQMPENEQQTVTQTNPAPAPAAPAVDAAAVRKEGESAGTQAERKRIAGINELARKHKLDDAFVTRAIESGKSIADVKSDALEALAGRSESTPVDNKRVEGGDLANAAKRREGVENAIMNRFDSRQHKLTEDGRHFRGMTLLEVARSYLEAAGINTRGMGKMDLAGIALGLPVNGFRAHSTSDFPELLANVAGKTLRQAYESSPKTFQPISRAASLPDFKQVSRVSMGGAPKFEKVLQGGQIKVGSIGEGAEKYALATYAKIVSITRQVIINDDMDAFTRVPMLMGREAADLEGDLAWGEITANGAMADAVALFHGTHGNLGTGGAISETTLTEMRSMMRLQKGLNSRVLNLSPAYLIGPAALENKILQFLNKEIISTKASDVNTFKGTMLPIIEPRLDAASATAWYAAASPNQIDVLELGYLDGNDGVYVETQQGFEVDGIQVKGRLDVAAKVIDYRGLFKNAGV